MLILLFYLFIAIVALQFFYYTIVFSKFSFAKIQKTSPKRIPISVIVCAKNKEKNVVKLIPLLVEQNYPDFEIILIDDASSDSTLDLFEEFEKQYSNIKLVKVVNNEAFWGNKKFALTMGIKAATNEHLLFTDADCYPASKDWISSMSAEFTSDKTIVLGYGAHEKIESSFINKIIRFDALLNATQYFSWTKIGHPYMGIGRNLAYKKDEFFKINGYIDHMKIRAGHDDLFVNQASNGSNTACCFAEESFTYREPKTNYKDWTNLKKRHFATSSFYKPFDRLQLSVFFLSQILFIILPLILLIFQYQLEIVLYLIGFRYLFTWIVLGFSAEKLKEKDVMYWYPIIEIVFVFTQLNIFVSNSLSKPVRWK